jgi:hypothetical protein
MFRTLEILMRNLITISQNHFHAIDPKSVGKEKKDDMTKQQRTYHKMVFGIREFGEVAPARIKGDKSGESTLIKKALLKFVRLARHANIDGIIDYQNAADAESAIRNQIDIWLIKKWTEDLGGEHFAYLFKRVNSKRQRILERRDWTNKAYSVADSLFPPIENLTYYWMYVKKLGVQPYLDKVPELHIRHKEPDDKWDILTGIELKHDKELVASSGGSSTPKARKSDIKMTFLTIKDMKENSKQKKLTWNQVIDKMKEKQETEGVSFHLDFKNVKEGSLSKMYSRWLKLQKELE